MIIAAITHRTPTLCQAFLRTLHGLTHLVLTVPCEGAT